MQTPEALERIAFELVEDAAAENVWYMEVRYAPILSTKRGLSPRQVVDAVERGLRRGQEAHPRTQSYQIICIAPLRARLRRSMAALAVEQGQGVRPRPRARRSTTPPRFREAFYPSGHATQRHGPPEAYGPESIHQALHWAVPTASVTACGCARIRIASSMAIIVAARDVPTSTRRGPGLIDGIRSGAFRLRLRTANTDNG
jgi:hypothetical protein